MSSYLPSYLNPFKARAKVPVVPDWVTFRMSEERKFGVNKIRNDSEWLTDMQDRYNNYLASNRKKNRTNMPPLTIEEYAAFYRKRDDMEEKYDLYLAENNLTEKELLYDDWVNILIEEKYNEYMDKYHSEGWKERYWARRSYDDEEPPQDPRSKEEWKADYRRENKLDKLGGTRRSKRFKNRKTKRRRKRTF